MIFVHFPINVGGNVTFQEEGLGIMIFSCKSVLYDNKPLYLTLF